MFHVKQFGKVPGKNLTSAQQGFAFAHVGTAKIYVRLKARASAPRQSHPADAGQHLRRLVLHSRIIEKRPRAERRAGQMKELAERGERRQKGGDQKSSSATELGLMTHR